MGQHKGKDYFYSEEDKKFLFSYFTYWGFSEILGQPTFYYYANSDVQCPDGLTFKYYSWKTQGSASAKPKCIRSSQPEPVKDQVIENFPEMEGLGDRPPPPPAPTQKTTQAISKTTTTRATTTTKATECEITNVSPVRGGTWKCTESVVGVRCAASCDDPQQRPQCSESNTLLCVGTRWNAPNTKCECKTPVGTCGAIQALKPLWIKRKAQYKCSAENKVGSQCNISCPYKNFKPYCRSTQLANSFTCQNDLRWSNNLKNDCECLASCAHPEEEFSPISKDIVPNFSGCTSLFKNRKCRAVCPSSTYQRKGARVLKALQTQCLCKGSACHWAVNRKIVKDLFCIKKNYCEKPSAYFINGLETNVLECNTDAENGLFYPQGAECRLNCKKVTKKVSNGMRCQCFESGNCAWVEAESRSKRAPKALSTKMRIKCET